MSQAAVIFPHQLFLDHPALAPGRPVYLVEDQLFFSDRDRRINFHKKKLLLHRASMKAYQDLLLSRGFSVHYVDYVSDPEMAYLFQTLYEGGVDRMLLADPVDHFLERRLRHHAKSAGMEVLMLDTPSFLSPPSWFRLLLKGQKRLNQTGFYIAQRKRLGLLLEDGKPAGGSWTFDRENRKPLPRELSVPRLPPPANGAHIEEAKSYVEQRFPHHPGSTKGFFYPVSHEEASVWLQDFLGHRLRHFGSYEDAISREEPFLFHSLLSPLLNTGLLTPAQVVQTALEYSRDHPVPLNSLEGFLRQIIGWREFMRAVYVLVGERERSSNFWGNNNQLPGAFYRGDTGLEPLDAAIARVNQNAYAHHIERLMVLGNFLLLCEVHPDWVYRWFMEMFIDSYDWVMVPNVYGMSQFADGGLMSTKPYISSSSYLRKMSNFGKGSWSSVWDALFWRFVHLHRDFFTTSPRIRFVGAHLKGMSQERLQGHLSLAQDFLQKLHLQAPAGRLEVKAPKGGGNEDAEMRPQKMNGIEAMGIADEPGRP
ncbi:MAG: cryptochrome/photolyase family protein [Methanosarcinales archaeon]|nr:cryptochrome/photolyase family protein [Methanosarcinales archaeon]